MSKELFITIDKSKAWHNTKKLWDQVKDLENGKYKITISKADKRSMDQNAYYWQMLENYVQPGLYALGWQEIKYKEDAHDFMREMFLKARETNEQTGEERNRIKSTTELTRIEFSEYLEQIWRWAAEYLSIYIPAPNEQLKIV